MVERDAVPSEEESRGQNSTVFLFCRDVSLERGPKFGR